MRGTLQRLSSERTGRVKNSTSWPGWRNSPWAARRAMPTRGLGASDGSRGREAIGSFAFCSPQKITRQRVVVNWQHIDALLLAFEGDAAVGGADLQQLPSTVELAANFG